MKGSGSAEFANHITEPFEDANLRENLMIEIVLLVTELQQVGNGILERANPDLQRAPIFDQSADVQRNQIFCRTYGFIRCAEEREGISRLVNNGIEVRRGDCRITIHEGEVRVYLSEQRNLCPMTFRLTQERHRIQSQIRITTKAVRKLNVCFGFSNQLRQYIDASVQQIPHHVSVVTAHIALLRE